MYRNYLFTAIRVFINHKLPASINILGLATGIAACFLIYLYLADEYRYDTCWYDVDRIYRVNETFFAAGSTDPFAAACYNAGEQMKQSFAEIEEFARIYNVGKASVRKDEITAYEDKMYFADSGFFTLFNYAFIAGNPQKALTQPKTIVISEQLAKVYFPAKQAVGDFIEINKKPYLVTGVFRQPETGSHIHASAFVSMVSMNKAAVESFKLDWTRLGFYTYIKFVPGTDVQSFTKKMEAWTTVTLKPWLDENKLSLTVFFSLTPVKDIHFTTAYRYDMPDNSDKKYQFILMCVGIFILLIASFNYMNLAIATGFTRAREVGVRKASGSYRRQIIVQFIGESFVLTLFSILVAIAITELLLPFMNNLTGKQLVFISLETIPQLLTLILVFVFITGFLAGFYPSLVLSKFDPVVVLKSSSLGFTQRSTGYISSRLSIRNLLVLLQFVLSIVMIIITIIVFMQIKYMQKKSLGFNGDQVYVISIPADSAIYTGIKAFNQELRSNPMIREVSSSVNVPGETHGRLMFNWQQEGRTLQEAIDIYLADESFDKVLDLKLDKGRWFSDDFKTDNTSAVVINQAAATYLGISENPIGFKLSCGFLPEVKVVGVVSDFNYKSLHSAIEPLIILPDLGRYRFLLVKISGEDIASVVNFIDTKWRAFDAGHPLESFFVDQKFGQQYKNDRQMLGIIGFFALLTIVISTLGLFALSAFNIRKRRKEIGIRKALGASVKSLVWVLAGEFSVIVIVANLLAWPAAYMAATSWLSRFPYPVPVQVWPFALAALVSFTVAWGTVFFQTWLTARENPVEALKYE